MISRDIISSSLQHLRNKDAMKIICSSNILMKQVKEERTKLNIMITKYMEQQVKIDHNTPPDLSIVISCLELSDLNLSSRLYNKLIKSNIKTVGQLNDLAVKDYKRLKLGIASIIEIKDKLAKIYLACNNK